MAMHRLYREVYAAHGDKEVYSAEESAKVVDTFLAGFADAFGVEKAFFRSLIPAIVTNSSKLIRNGMSIDELLLNVSLLALKESRVVTGMSLHTT